MTPGPDGGGIEGEWTTGLGRRVGVLAGTFDPLHLGHVVLAQRAAEHLALTAVVLLATAAHPHRSPAGASLPARRALLHLGIDGDARLVAPPPWWSGDVFDLLRVLEPDRRRLHYLCGTDSARRLRRWNGTERLDGVAAVWAAPRRGVDTGAVEGVAELPIEVPPISATDIRARVRSHRPIRGLVPPGCERAVHDLYRSGQAGR